MKNLVVETQKTSIFNDTDFLPAENYCCCYNCDNERYYYINDHSKIIGIDVNSGKKCIDQKLTFREVDDDDELPKPVGIEYCSIVQDTFIAYEDGTVLAVTHSELNKLKFEDIAAFENGLQCIKVSPDHEMVILVTKDNTVITLNSNFDIIQETKLNSEEFGEKQFITVGWGKKETQFHGTEGKLAAKAQITIVGKTELDHGKAIVTWKGDGTLFAVSYIDIQNNARRFKVLNREGVLQYTSELVDSLEATLSWKPSGNLIASTRKLPNKHTVAFFEKNGLLHREFTIPFTTKNNLIIDLIWSRDSDILAVWYKELGVGATNIQLYSEKNYHWYLKQTITYTKINPILFATWGPQVNRDLLILSAKNTTDYTFNWTVSHSLGKQITDKSVVSVINGDKILLTNYRDGVVPPPMAQQTLQFKRPINAISFAPGHGENPELSSNDFLTLLCNNKIVLCKHVNESWENQYIHKKTYNIDVSSIDSNKYSKHVVQHIFWYEPNVALCSIIKGEKSTLCELELVDIEALDEILIDARVIHEMPGQIEHIIPSTDFKTAYIVVNSKLYSYNHRDGLQKSHLVITNENLTRAVTKIEFVKFGEREAIVALTRKHVLFVDGRQVANNVTSFFTHSEFLLITTQQHTLICFKLDDVGLAQLCTKDLTVQPWESEIKDIQRTQEINIRRVERGSILITAVSKDARTVLQMPRGNLECIQPRALSLAIIGNFIDELDYFKAFDLMRKQRIDLNLLYDHNPESFMLNIEKFVADIDNANWLSLFLTELNEDDVTTTTYASSYEGRKKSNGAEKNIDEICRTLRYFAERNSHKFVQPILISLVKNKKQTGLEEALHRIKEIKHCYEHKQQGCTPEEALKYLLYMVDVNVLYDIALGMYDFELVVLVAQKSQKDPKEYISFLNDLQDLEENYMKFTIDSHLKRHHSALEHIAKLPDKFDECLKFIRTHGLFSHGMKLFSCKSNEYKRIAVVYGNYLAGKGKYKEAGIMFTKGGDFEEALNAFKQAVSWRDAIVTAVKLNLSFERLAELYEDLVTALMHEKRYDEAAQILSKHLNRLEDAVATLCEGRHWHQAWTDAYCMKREDLIETHVKPGILDHAEFLLSQIRQRREDFQKHKNRLAVVRNEAVARESTLRAHFDAELDESGGPGRDFSDLFSDTTSIAGSTVTRSSQASKKSGKSYRSSKNRRKHERKMQSIKEGSVYEDLALIRSLHGLVSQAYKQRDEIKSIAEMLLLINGDKLAEELYKVMNGFLDDIKNGKNEIWPPTSENKNVDDEPSTRTSTNSNQFPHTDPMPNLIEPHLLQAPEEKHSSWKLDVFSVL